MNEALYNILKGVIYILADLKCTQEGILQTEEELRPNLIDPYPNNIF